MKNEHDPKGTRIMTSEVTQTTQQVFEFKRGFASVLSLNRIFFGPKTDEMIESIVKDNGSIIKVDRELFQKLLDARGKEIGYFPSE